MGQATFTTAFDEYDARNADSWTEEKLMILDNYLGGFATACKSVGGWYGLDLFAGTGLNWSVIRKKEIRGSPLVALDASPPAATKVMLAENHDGAFEALKYRTAAYGSRAELFNRDANEAIGDMLSLIPSKAPAFSFLDPEGSELEWPIVEKIADHKRGQSPNKVEQLILFPTDMGFIRAAGVAPESVTRIFGHEEWKEIYERRQANEMTPDQQRGEYVRLYADGLKQLGYATVLDRQITKSNGQPMYFLIFATDNEAGKKIMDSAFTRVKIRVAEELGQIPLFDMKPTERRTRLGEES
jgi:three-Cys-motif partner protein